MDAHVSSSEKSSRSASIKRLVLTDLLENAPRARPTRSSLVTAVLSLMQETCDFVRLDPRGAGSPDTAGVM